MISIPSVELTNAPYKPVWDFQEKILAHNLLVKKTNRSQGENQATQSAFLFCEHHPVYTLGKSGDMSNLKISEAQMKESDIDFWRINRGGDITFHGPGQITGYPIFDLEILKPSAAWFIETMEDAIIDTVAHFGIASQRLDGLPGVWVKGKTEIEDRKICAIGVKMSRYVSIHGFALNVSTDLAYFDQMIPCGIKDKQVTSISKECGRDIKIQEVIPVMKRQFEKHFDIQLVDSTLDHLNQLIATDGQC